MISTERAALYNAAINGDLERVTQLTKSCPEALNALDTLGESLLESVTSRLAEEPALHSRYLVLERILELGANPNILSEEGTSPLTPAVIAMDYELLELLLKAGADPNLPAGFTDEQSLYDWAQMDYVYETWIAPQLMTNGRSLENSSPSTQEDRANADSWLRYLDRCAQNQGLRRPDHLFLLRTYGALTASELSALTKP